MLREMDHTIFGTFCCFADAQQAQRRLVEGRVDRNNVSLHSADGIQKLLGDESGSDRLYRIAVRAADEPEAAVATTVLYDCGALDIEDRCGGCLNIGPMRSWLEASSEDAELRARCAVAALAS